MMENNSNKYSVLVCHKDSMTLHRISKSLAGEGHSVSKCESTEDLLDCLSVRNFDVVIVGCH